MLGAGEVGNDNPFWKGFASTDPSIKQRTQNLELAKALLQAAGAENLKFNITTWNFLDHPDHAASIQAYAREAGIDVGLEVMDVSEVLRLEPARDYCDHDAVAEPHGDADRVRRPRRAEHLPHAAATCRRATGTRRTTRTPSSTRSPRRTSRRPSSRPSGKATKRMAGLLLRDTPVITDYFISYVTASSSKVKNYVPEGISHVRLAKVGSPSGPRRRAAGARPRPPSRRSSRLMTRYILKRLGLALITLFLLSVIVFAISTSPPGQRRPVGARAVRDAGVGRRAQRAARHRPAGRRAVPGLGGRARAGRPRHVADAARCPPGTCSSPALVNSLKLALVAFLICVPSRSSAA